VPSALLLASLPILPILALVGLVGLAGLYALACWQLPFRVCRCRHVDPLCRACDGTGRRVRIGRRLFNYLRRLYDHR
jgi:hypothetical protein